MSPPDSVAEAVRLRDAREFAAAAELLARHLASHPDDAEAARLLAQTLYWMGDRPAAEARYDAALLRWPNDPWLRLDYGRMLLETGRARRAAAVVEPLRGGGPGAAGAEALLATAAYWGGDLTAAARGFRRALRLDPGQAEARRHLAEIEALAAPWVRIGSEHRGDSQPMQRSTLAVEAGWHLTPLRTVAARAEPQGFQAGGATSAFALEASVHDYWPALRTGLDVAAGIVRRGAGPGDAWTGRLALDVRAPRGVAVRAAAERAQYTWTLASVAEPVLTETASAGLAWNDPAGWMGEAGYALQRFPDDNRVGSAHAWVLAPLLRAGGARLSAGYGFGAQDARESRFAPAVGRAAGGAGTEGVYTPYYTPEQVVSHSALGALALPLGGGARLYLDGSYGFRAREQAPVPGQAGTVSFAERGFTPRRARGALRAAPAPGVTLALEGERSRTAFYTLTTLGASATYRFLPRAARR
jgi:tetratricopeptide (TPR) repeat protein